MTVTQPLPTHVLWTRQLEEAGALDPYVQSFADTVGVALGTGATGEALRGQWLGHAVHPLLTDLVIGTWTSASLLDLLGGPGTDKAAQRLVGLGLLAFAPTALTGWAEWSASGIREQRVGLVHVASNAVAAGAYLGSWRARRKGRRRTGAALALVGMGASGVGAYLGGHLAIGRKVGTVHPAFVD